MRKRERDKEKERRERERTKKCVFVIKIVKFIDDTKFSIFLKSYYIVFFVIFLAVRTWPCT